MELIKGNIPMQEGMPDQDSTAAAQESAPPVVSGPSMLRASSPLRPGFVVVQRRMPRPPGRRKAPSWGWTLHRIDCRHVSRATKALPAPVDAYPNTSPCVYCRPDGEIQVDPPRNGKTRKGTPAQRADRHIYEYSSTDGGEVIAKCLSCGLTASGATHHAARSRGYRLHREAAAKLGGDAA